MKKILLLGLISVSLFSKMFMLSDAGDVQYLKNNVKIKSGGWGKPNTNVSYETYFTMECKKNLPNSKNYRVIAMSDNKNGSQKILIDCY